MPSFLITGLSLILSSQRQPKQEAGAASESTDPGDVRRPSALGGTDIVGSGISVDTGAGAAGIGVYGTNEGSYTVHDHEKGEIILDLRSIVWLGSNRNRVVLHTKEGSHVVPGPLKDVLAALPDDFVQIHKQFAVRAEHIVGRRRLYGQLFVQLSDGEELPVGRRYSVQRNVSG